jgi:two-component system, LuxR family, response regulator FixJ
MKPMRSEPIVQILGDDVGSHQPLAQLIESKGLEVEVRKSTQQALGECVFGRPGCVLLDVKELGPEDLAALAAFNAETFHLPVVVVSGETDVGTAVGAMKAGALDFLEKPCRGDDVWAAVADALRCDARNRKEFAKRRRYSRRIERLTPGEQAVLKMAVAGKTNKMMAEALHVSVRAIEVRRAKLMGKLHVDSLAELIKLMIYAEGISE